MPDERADRLRKVTCAEPEHESQSVKYRCRACRTVHGSYAEAASCFRVDFGLQSPPMSARRCQYGVLGVLTCHAVARTKRPQPGGGDSWDVCEYHAAFLDRLRRNIEEHRPLLDRLAELG